VPAETVADFFSSYVTHPKARKVNSALLAEFVRAMAAGGELTSWTVALVGGGSGQPREFPGGLQIGRMLKRSPDPDIKDRYSIGRLLSPKDEAMDLDCRAWAAAMELTLRSWNPDAARQKDGVAPKPPQIPNGPSIRRVRGFGADGVPPAPRRGLLLIYPLDPIESGLDSAEFPVMGFGVSFPTSVSTTKVVYQVDHLLWETEYGPAD
jgi:hypothetical protein